MTLSVATTPTQAGGRDHADGTGDHGSLVGQDVAEHVLGDDDVKLGRILADLHSAVVHKHFTVLEDRNRFPALM